MCLISPLLFLKTIIQLNTYFAVYGIVSFTHFFIRGEPLPYERFVALVCQNRSRTLGGGGVMSFADAPIGVTMESFTKADRLFYIHETLLRHAGFIVGLLNVGRSKSIRKSKKLPGE